MTRRRVAVVLIVAAVATVSARLAAPTNAHVVKASLHQACGVERWKIKTLQDRPRLLPVQSKTVLYLATQPAPKRLPATRLPFERHIFRVTAAVTLVRREADSDLHLVLQDGTNHMIAEAPLSPSCAPKALRQRRQQMTTARKAVRLCARAQVSGVAFFDFNHGQTGMAPNGIELHPILAFRCLAAPPPPPPPPACSDGIDNDGDGLIDYPADPGCSSASDTDETDVAPPPPPPPPAKCAASYPTVCIPPPPPDLNCSDIPYRNFTVLWNVPDPDPHHFDGDRDGIGCES